MQNTSITRSFLPHFKAYTLALFAIVLFTTGCKVIEENTPLGCNKQEGRYFDPAQGVCVSVTTTIDAYRLNNYRYVNKLIAEGDKEAEFVVYFAKYLSEKEYATLMKDIHPVQIKEFAIQFASGDNTGGNTENLEVNDELVKKALKATLDDYLINGGSDNKEVYVASLLSQYQKGKFGIPDTIVTSTPTAIKVWWDAHRDKICAVQPRINWLDDAQLGECEPWKEE